MEIHRAFGQRVDELVHQRVGAVAHFVGRALRGDAAVGQDDHVVGDAEGFFQVVRHDDAGEPSVSLSWRISCAGGAQRDRVEAGEGLVVHHEFGVERDGARQRHAPRHAAGHLAGHQVARAAQAHGIELHQHDVAHQRFGQLRCARAAESHVVEHAHVGEQAPNWNSMPMRRRAA
jgi:hypothetical protein